MAKKKVENKQVNKKNNRTLYAFLATFLSIIGSLIVLLIALIAKRGDKYVIYYAKVSLVIFVLGAIGGLFISLLKWIPIIGQIINFAIGILILILWLLSWIYALSNKEKDIPVVSDLARKIDL